jgi:hypothetical protein
MTWGSFLSALLAQAGSLSLAYRQPTAGAGGRDAEGHEVSSDETTDARGPEEIADRPPQQAV